MPLPLIAAVGAGILGGRRYLLNKQDEKQAQAGAAQLSQFVMDSPALNSQPHLQQELLMGANSALNSGSTFGDFDRTGALAEVYEKAQAYQRDVMKTQQDQNFKLGMQANTLQRTDRSLDQADARLGIDRERFGYQQQQDALNRENTDANQARLSRAEYMTMSNDLQKDIAPHQTRYQNQQGIIRQASEMMRPDSGMTGMDMWAAQQSMIRTMIDEAITEGDMDTQRQAAGAMTQLEMIANKYLGKNPDAERFRTESLGVLQTMNKLNENRWLRAKTAMDERATRWGVDARDVYSTSYEPYAVPSMSIGGGGGDDVDDDQYTYTKPQTRIRGRGDRR